MGKDNRRKPIQHSEDEEKGREYHPESDSGDQEVRDLNRDNQEFEDAIIASKKNAHSAGKEAARNLLSGFIQGVGKKTGELVISLINNIGN